MAVGRLDTAGLRPRAARTNFSEASPRRRQPAASCDNKRLPLARKHERQRPNTRALGGARTAVSRPAGARAGPGMRKMAPSGARRRAPSPAAEVFSTALPHRGIRRGQTHLPTHSAVPVDEPHLVGSCRSKSQSGASGLRHAAAKEVTHAQRPRSTASSMRWAAAQTSRFTSGLPGSAVVALSASCSLCASCWSSKSWKFCTR